MGLGTHPSTKFYLLAAVFTVLALIFAVIAEVVPAWSRMKGTTSAAGVLSFNELVAEDAYRQQLMRQPSAEAAAGQAEGTLQFIQNPTIDSVLYYGHWVWCMYYSDDLSSYTCSRTLGYTAPAFDDPTCAGYLYTSRILGVVTIGFIFLTLLVAGYLFKSCSSFDPAVVWMKPAGLAAAAPLLAFITMGLSLATWATWMVVAETNCRLTTLVQLQGAAVTTVPPANVVTPALPLPGTFNPVQGYSVSFICEIFASSFLFLALLTLLLGFLSLGKVEKAYPVQDTVVTAPYQPVSYPVGPVVVEAPLEASYVGAPTVLYSTPAY